jgi:hypothetical protein
MIKNGSGSGSGGESSGSGKKTVLICPELDSHHRTRQHMYINFHMHTTADWNNINKILPIISSELVFTMVLGRAHILGISCETSFQTKKPNQFFFINNFLAGLGDPTPKSSQPAL